MFAAAVPWLDDAFGAVARGFGYGFLNLIYSLGYTVGPIVGGVALDARRRRPRLRPGGGSAARRRRPGALARAAVVGAAAAASRAGRPAAAA